MTADDAGRVFEALADPTRREVVRRLAADGPLTATELAGPLGMSRQAVALGARNSGGRRDAPTEPAKFGLGPAPQNSLRAVDSAPFGQPR